MFNKQLDENDILCAGVNHIRVGLFIVLLISAVTN